MALQDTNYNIIEAIIKAQRTLFASGATKPIKYRRLMLINLLNALNLWEERIYEALWKDLHKCKQEALLTEVSIVKAEIKTHLRHIKKWTKDKKVATPFTLFPSKSKIITQPLGNTLIVAPWNYPLQLLLMPLIGAISAGCTAVLKPSCYVPHVAKVMEDMLLSTFNTNYIAVIQGDKDVNTLLFSEKFDLIFLTGSPNLGRVVMREAAKHLTPVILELGGKSPCIVDKEADLEMAAKRVAWGKTLNGGQTCVAPDYLLIHKDLKDKFVSRFKFYVNKFYGTNPLYSNYLVRMVNDNAFDRVVSYLKDGKILCGGGINKAEKYIEPTIIEVTDIHSPIMQEEIFGPVLPLITFSAIDDVLTFINSKEKPLALYYFGNPGKGEYILNNTISGGACINDVIIHIANDNLAFGGVGNSGMGSYHGYKSFEAFSHKCSVLLSPKSFDLPFRYAPYKFWALVKKLVDI